MKAGDVMTRRVVSIAPEASIGAAAKLMWTHRISGLPVVDKAGHLVGVVTESDFLRRVEIGTERHHRRWWQFFMGRAREADEYVHSHGRRIEDVMTRDPVVITPETPLDEVVGLMEQHRIKRVPVMRGRRLVGIVSRANLLHSLASLARAPAPRRHNDAAIRARIFAELDKHAFGRRAGVNVVVHDGIAELWGEIDEEQELQAIKVLVETVPGVTSIRDHLVLTDRISVT